MRESAKRLTISVATAAICVVLFTVPMVLRYKIYHEGTVSLSSGDVIPVTQQVSSVWCSGQSLRSEGNISFQTYFLPEEPDLLSSQEARETFSYYSDLPAAGVEYWGFYLPKGSWMNLSTCARLPGASVTVLRGQKTLKECLEAFRNRGPEDESEESEESESDDDPNLSSSISSSEGVITHEDGEEGAFNCPHHSVLHKSLGADSSCSQENVTTGRILRYLESSTFESDGTNYYYIVFSSGAILNLMLNKIHWTLNLDRTTFDLSSSQLNCSSFLEPDGQCHVALDFSSTQICMVRMSNTSDGTVPLTDVIVSTCEPRKGLYFVFFLMIFLAIGFCAFH